MKVTIVRDKSKEEISIDGDTVIPWYINVLSITWNKDGIEFYVLEDYIIKKMYSSGKLFIIGKNKMTLTEQIDAGIPKNEIDFPKVM